MMKESRWLIFLFFVFLFDSIKVQAHTQPYAAEKMSPGNVVVAER